MTLGQVREQLRDIVAGLESIRARLLAVQASLPEEPAEKFRLLDVEEGLETTELRAAIGCVLEDSLRPAVDDLRAAHGALPP